MSITYTTGIPEPTHNPSVDAPNMQTNTNSIDTWNAVDHYSFSSASAGHHKKSVYVVQASDPGSAATQAVQYSKTTNGSSELYLQRDAVSAAIQLTSGTTKINGNWVSGSSGQTFLPGGLQLKWGVTSVPSSVTVTYTSLSGLTVFPTAALTGWVTAKSTGIQFNITNITTTQISISTGTGGTATCLWFALGY